MVKIRELTDKQLTAQIAKYDRILNSLLKERKVRIKNGTPVAKLMTDKEREIAEKFKEQGVIGEEALAGQTKTVDLDKLENQTQSQVKPRVNQSETVQGFEVDAEDLVALQNADDNSEDEEEEAAEEVRVTQLLQLNQDQLEELRKNSKASKKKKKKKGLFGL
ncbi:MAG: hypothetical protein ACPGJV_13890 [Bacteriovoracaceae bacterium]